MHDIMGTYQLQASVIVIIISTEEALAELRDYQFVSLYLSQCSADTQPLRISRRRPPTITSLNLVKGVST